MSAAPLLPARYRWAGLLSALAFVGLALAGLSRTVMQQGHPPSIATGFNAALDDLQRGGAVPVEQLENAAAIAVNERHAHRYNLATALAAQGKTEAAVAQFRAALAVKPDYAVAHRDLGMLLLRTARKGEPVDAAIAHLQAAVRFDGNDGAAFFGLGNALGRAGQWQPAVAALRQAVALGVRAPALQHNLGVGLRALGDETGARAAFEAALALDPGYARSRAALSGR
ncbi:MAG: tetratricopeptide repeat protein [Deltaproteobacteria bacterium]|nr:tetratricopeptide repeat protein [Deltaproteobacteria bacterium]